MTDIAYMTRAGSTRRSRGRAARVRLAAATALFTLFTAACGSDNDPVTVTETPQLSLRGTWQATVTGTAARPTLAGTAEVSDYGPYFDIDFGITGGAPSTVYSWRIYRGTCAGTVVAADQHSSTQAYPNLTTDASGAASISRTISGPLDTATQYHVRVSTVAAPVTLVGCGPLTHS